MLNQEQEKAVKILNGPLRIIAGAGTGKTHTITERIDHLVKTGIPPHKILALTFTNKAAHEIRERLSGHDNVMTFHSLAARLLRKFWKEDFTINDANDPETLDFDQLLVKLLEILADCDILTNCQNLFDHILVDEYQDVNPAQIAILQKLSGFNQNLCIVGDPDQTIYSWRGADPSAIAKFTKLYPTAKTITLTQNYRNPPNILKSAQTLIAHNPDRLEKELQPTKTDDVTTKFWQLNDGFEEIEVLLHLLEQSLGSHHSMTDADHLDTGNEQHKYTFGDIAIIYRTQQQGRKIAASLRKRGYPCQLSLAEDFWERAEVKQFLQDLSVLKNLEKFSDKKFSDWISERLNDFFTAQELSTEKQNRLNLLLPLSINFDSSPTETALKQFLDEACVSQEADNLLNPNAIQLLTFHAAKGLEFSVVIIVGLEEENMPHKRSLSDPAQLEEERRLLYVGMTRAKEALHLITNRKAGAPSRFLSEIEYTDRLKLPEERNLKLKKLKIKRAQQSLF